jgi:integrase
LVRVGFTRKRIDVDGKPRYTGYYRDLRGREVSAGTFARKADADAAWQAAEVGVRAGVRHDPRRGRQTFQHYVEQVWLPNHRMELSTRQDYSSAIDRHIMWFFGPLKMRDIGSEQVREWITALTARGVLPRRIEYSKNSVLNAIFTTALDDGVVVHPSHRVSTSPVPRKPRTIITTQQFDALYAALPDADAQLLLETAIETGLRWSELTELRVRDVDFPSGRLTVSRAVIAVSRRHHPDGRRLAVKEYLKDREWRRLGLSEQIVRKLSAHVTTHGLGADDLFFVRRPDPGPRPAVPADPATLGLTTPNAAGRQYRHGTTTAYGLGKCRCAHCRRAVAAYRAERRRAGKDRPGEGRPADPDPHLNASTFRTRVLQPALAAAGVKSTMHGLRHAHASWLLAGGADLQVVKERLGHAKIATTEGYLHTLPDADETALTALGKIRGGRGGGCARGGREGDRRVARGGRGARAATPQARVTADRCAPRPPTFAPLLSARPPSRCCVQSEPPCWLIARPLPLVGASGSLLIRMVPGMPGVVVRDVPGGV